MAEVVFIGIAAGAAAAANTADAAPAGAIAPRMIAGTSATCSTNFAIS